MKKVLLIISLLLTSTVFPMTAANAEQCAVMGPNGCLLTEAQAQNSDNGGGGECSASNPCGTWAVIDSNNAVSNVIVCQPSVCGTGQLEDSRVVLQVPANDLGKHQTAYRGTLDNPIKYDFENEVFTQGSLNFPASVSRTEVVDSVTLSAIINSIGVTFGPNSFINGKMEFTPVVDTSTRASMSATKVNGNSTITQTLSFTTPQTVEQIRSSITEELGMLRTHLNKLLVLLKGWVKN
jgi:hypothetical protein